MALPGLLLIIVLGLLSQGVQARLRSAVYRRRALILAGPLLLTAIFSVAAWTAGAASVPLSLLVLAYTLAPTLSVLLPRATVGVAHWADLAGILLLWLPLEFAAGASLVPKPAQGYLHAVAYGVAIVLALWLFLIYRALKGVKYNLPRRRQDLLYPPSVSRYWRRCSASWVCSSAFLARCTRRILRGPRSSLGIWSSSAPPRCRKRFCSEV